MALFQSVQAMIAETDASLQTAKLNRSYAEIRAPENGLVTNRTVQAGNYVQVGQVLFSLVPRNLYVIANFKEDQLQRMRPGQATTIHIDSLPGKGFPGHVNSIQAGSGARFSLLPAENATGNYVKVVQRVPVKILFDQIPQTELPLGPGESVSPTVQVQEFNYSPSQITGIIAGLMVILCLINWWGTRRKQSAQAVAAKETGENLIKRNQSTRFASVREGLCQPSDRPDRFHRKTGRRLPRR
jgi:membrane fusion protein, multidrug efflux system